MAKWADYVIVAVKYNLKREHIVKVRRYKDDGENLIDLQEKTRGQIVTALGKGLTYVTATKVDGQWIKGADVKIHDDDYIKTKPNSSKRDNLGELPEF